MVGGSRIWEKCWITSGIAVQVQWDDTDEQCALLCKCNISQMDSAAIQDLDLNYGTGLE